MAAFSRCISSARSVYRVDGWMTRVGHTRVCSGNTCECAGLDRVYRWTPFLSLHLIGQVLLLLSSCLLFSIQILDGPLSLELSDTKVCEHEERAFYRVDGPMRSVGPSRMCAGNRFECVGRAIVHRWTDGVFPAPHWYKTCPG